MVEAALEAAHVVEAAPEAGVGLGTEGVAAEAEAAVEAAASLVEVAEVLLVVVVPQEVVVALAAVVAGAAWEAKVALLRSSSKNIVTMAFLLLRVKSIFW